MRLSSHCIISIHVFNQNYASSWAQSARFFWRTRRTCKSLVDFNMPLFPRKSLKPGVCVHSCKTRVNGTGGLWCCGSPIALHFCWNTASIWQYDHNYFCMLSERSNRSCGTSLEINISTPVPLPPVRQHMHMKLGDSISKPVPYLVEERLCKKTGIQIVTNTDDSLSIIQSALDIIVIDGPESAVHLTIPH